MICVHVRMAHGFSRTCRVVSESLTTSLEQHRPERRWDTEPMSVFYGFFFLRCDILCKCPLLLWPHRALRNEIITFPSPSNHKLMTFFLSSFFRRRYEIPFNFWPSHHPHWGRQRDLNDIFSQPLISAACPIVRWVECATCVRGDYKLRDTKGLWEIQLICNAFLCMLWVTRIGFIVYHFHYFISQLQ